MIKDWVGIIWDSYIGYLHRYACNSASTHCHAIDRTPSTPSGGTISDSIGRSFQKPWILHFTLYSFYYFYYLYYFMITHVLFLSLIVITYVIPGDCFNNDVIAILPQGPFSKNVQSLSHLDIEYTEYGVRLCTLPQIILEPLWPWSPYLLPLDGP